LQQWKRRSRGEKTLEALREVVRSRRTGHDSNDGVSIAPDAVNTSREQQVTFSSRQEPALQPEPAHKAETASSKAGAGPRTAAGDSLEKSSLSTGMRTAPSQGISSASSRVISAGSQANTRSAPSLPAGQASPSRQSLPEDFFDPVVDGTFNGSAKEEATATAADIKADAMPAADSLSAIAMRAAQVGSDPDHEERPLPVRQQPGSRSTGRLTAFGEAAHGMNGDLGKASDAFSAAKPVSDHHAAVPEAFDLHTDEEAVHVGEISEPVLDLKQWTRSKPWVGIDEQVDLVVGLESWQGWQGERLLQAFQGLRRIGTKPLLLEAQVLSDPQQAWVAVVPGLRFVRVRLGLLLANRSGPLKPTEYSDFLSALQPVRDLLQASWTDGTAPAGMHEVLERARRVDASCAALDAQVVINLALGEAISTLAFSRMGMSLGLVDRGNTRQASLTGNGIELFSMTLGSKPDWMTFMLDVPRSPMEESPWQKMMDCAAAAVGRFGGQLLDDNGLVLEAHQLATIGKQVMDRQQQLIDAGYAPGSPLALRLFN
jgi:hypothetical protein